MRTAAGREGGELERGHRVAEVHAGVRAAAGREVRGAHRHEVPVRGGVRLREVAHGLGAHGGHELAERRFRGRVDRRGARREEALGV